VTGFSRYFSGISYDVNKISPTSFSAVTPQCLSQFSNYGCQGLTVDLVAAISPAAIEGFKPACVNKVPSQAFGKIIADQLASFSVAACNSFWSSQISAMPPTAAPGLTAACVANFSTSGTLGACAGFTAPFMVNMSAATFSGFTSACINSIPSAAVSQLTADQLAALQPSSCSGFWKSQVTNFPASAAPGMSSDCAAFLTSSNTLAACGGFTASFIGAMTPKSFSGFTFSCINALPSASVSNITAEQFAAMNYTNCVGFWKSQVTSFDPAAAPGVSAKCANYFVASGSLSACGGFTSAFIGSMTPEGFGGFRLNCFNNMPSDALSSVSKEQFAAVNPTSCYGFWSRQVEKFPALSASGLSADCLSNFSTTGSINGCAGLTSAFVGNMTATTFSGFLGDCIYQTPSDVFSSISAEQLQSIPAVSFRRFYNQFGSIPDAAVSEIFLDQATNLSSGLGGIVASQFVIIINKFKVDVVDRWTQKQITFSLGTIESKRNLPRTDSQLLTCTQESKPY